MNVVKIGRFGEDVLESMLEFTESTVHSSIASGMIASNPVIVDIGTGNGVFLHKLAKLGYGCTVAMLLCFVGNCRMSWLECGWLRRVHVHCSRLLFTALSIIKTSEMAP